MRVEGGSPTAARVSKQPENRWSNYCEGGRAVPGVAGLVGLGAAVPGVPFQGSKEPRTERRYLKFCRTEK